MTHRGHGRPFDVSRDAVILDAVVQLIAERGSLDFSMAELVHRAKVSTATVYRRWPTRETLILDALASVFAASPQPDRGDARTEILETLERQRDAMSSPLYAIAFPVAIAETTRRTEAGRRFAARTFVPLRREVAEIYRRGVARGQLRDAIDAESFADLLIGPMLRYLAETGRPPTRRFIEQIADAVADGLAIRPETPEVPEAAETARAVLEPARQQGATRHGGHTDPHDR